MYHLWKKYNSLLFQYQSKLDIASFAHFALVTYCNSATLRNPINEKNNKKPGFAICCFCGQVDYRTIQKFSSKKLLTTFKLPGK